MIFRFAASLGRYILGVTQKINDFYEDNKDFITGIAKYIIFHDENIDAASDKWAEYGWVPLLPNYDMRDMMQSIFPPKTPEEADIQMLGYLSEQLDELQTEISGMLKKRNGNIDIFNEACLSFDSDFFQASSLCLFAVIDNIILTNQSISKSPKNHRKLPNAFAKELKQNEDATILTSFLTTIKMIGIFYEPGNDFIKQDTSLNRNYLCHGMNSYKSTKKDCLKLFVLVYSLLVFIDTDVIKPYLLEKTAETEAIQQ